MSISFPIISINCSYACLWNSMFSRWRFAADDSLSDFGRLQLLAGVTAGEGSSLSEVPAVERTCTPIKAALLQDFPLLSRRGSRVLDRNMHGLCGRSETCSCLDADAEWLMFTETTDDSAAYSLSVLSHNLMQVHCSWQLIHLHCWQLFDVMMNDRWLNVEQLDRWSEIVAHTSFWQLVHDAQLKPLCQLSFWLQHLFRILQMRYCGVDCWHAERNTKIGQHLPKLAIVKVILPSFCVLFITVAYMYICWTSRSVRLQQSFLCTFVQL